MEGRKGVLKHKEDSHASQATLAGLLGLSACVLVSVCQRAPGIDSESAIRRSQCVNAPKCPTGISIESAN